MPREELIVEVNSFWYWFFISLPVLGTLIGFGIAFLYIKACDEWSLRQWFQDAYLEGVKPTLLRLQGAQQESWSERLNIRTLRLRMGGWDPLSINSSEPVSIPQQMTTSPLFEPPVVSLVKRTDFVTSNIKRTKPIAAEKSVEWPYLSD